MTFNKLYKKATTGKIVEWQIEVDGDKYRTTSGQQGGNQIVHDWTTCTGKNIGRANETSPSHQAKLEATSKHNKQLEKGHYVEDINDLDKETYFKVMLAKSYDKRKDKMSFNKALLQAKLDGIRFITRNGVGHSRNGKPMGGASFIVEAMQHLFEAYPDLITDGELYNHEYKDDFGALVSLIKRDASKITPEKQENIEANLQYHIYDVPCVNGLKSDADYCDRYNSFWAIIDKEFPELKSILHKVPYKYISTHQAIEDGWKAYVADGYEGAIIRYNTKYENKRTWNLLKVKKFLDDEFEIVEVLEGRGKKAGTAGSMTMKLPNGELFNTNIKGGYSVYDEIWKERDALVGKTATIRFFEYTEYGVPRFPYATKINREGVE